ncbi:hypothetical protein TNCV_2528911 [Trichonephila clavipes]|nr:hypothetical protein TNCV_2528911 [Trichonephila clavipes]
MNKEVPTESHKVKPTRNSEIEKEEDNQEVQIKGFRKEKEIESQRNKEEDFFKRRRIECRKGEVSRMSRMKGMQSKDGYQRKRTIRVKIENIKENAFMIMSEEEGHDE